MSSPHEEVAKEWLEREKAHLSNKGWQFSRLEPERVPPQVLLFLSRLLLLLLGAPLSSTAATAVWHDEEFAGRVLQLPVKHPMPNHVK